jgi:hypothetical protein
MQSDFTRARVVRAWCRSRHSWAAATRRQDRLLLRDRSDNGLLGVSRLRRAANALQIGIRLQRDASLCMNRAAPPGGYLAETGRSSPPCAATPRGWSGIAGSARLVSDSSRISWSRGSTGDRC